MGVGPSDGKDKLTSGAPTPEKPQPRGQERAGLRWRNPETTNTFEYHTLRCARAARVICGRSPLGQSPSSTKRSSPVPWGVHHTGKMHRFLLQNRAQKRGGKCGPWDRGVDLSGMWRTPLFGMSEPEEPKTPLSAHVGCATYWASKNTAAR